MNSKPLVSAIIIPSNTEKFADPEKCLHMHVNEPARWEMQSPTSSRVERIVQIVSDICQKPWEKLRVLVYTCLNFMFAI
jgi:hypothetical protein